MGNAIIFYLICSDAGRNNWRGGKVRKRRPNKAKQTEKWPRLFAQSGRS